MKLSFLGANRCVTGSRYCLEANQTRVMIDCGLAQEREHLHRNWEDCPVPARSIDNLLLTHVHIDHSGLIPKFVREGFRGRIFATKPTIDLANIVLYDSAKIHEEDAAYKKKRHRREGRSPVKTEQPLYTSRDVERALKLLRGVNYRQNLQVANGIEATFHDAGHILGSAMLEIIVTENGSRQRIIFSGDVGQGGKPLISDPTNFEQADFVVMESTYGDRLHDKVGDIESQLCEVIIQTVARGGNVIIPTFAIERAQELLFYIGKLVRSGRIAQLPVFLDSPMAVDVTEIFRKHLDQLDEGSRQVLMSSQPPLSYPGLQLVTSIEESKRLNQQKQPSIILSPAGMCTAGRIKHHLQNNIGRPEATILFVGYQAQGTLGRQILEGRKEVRIHGEPRQVHASVAHINGLSGHADQHGLLNWLGHLREAPKKVFLTHGEEAAARVLGQAIDQRFGWPTEIPQYLSSVALT